VRLAIGEIGGTELPSVARRSSPVRTAAHCAERVCLFGQSRLLRRRPRPSAEASRNGDVDDAVSWVHRDTRDDGGVDLDLMECENCATRSTRAYPVPKSSSVSPHTERFEVVELGQRRARTVQSTFSVISSASATRGKAPRRRVPRAPLLAKSERTAGLPRTLTETTRSVAAFRPAGAVLAGTVQHPFTDRNDQPLPGDRDELGRGTRPRAGSAQRRSASTERQRPVVRSMIGCSAT